MKTDAGQVTQDDITVDSNHETIDQIQLAFAESDTTDTSNESIPAPVPQKEIQDAAAPSLSTDDTPEEKLKLKSNRRNNPTEAVKSAVSKQREAERRAEAAEARIQEMITPSSPPASEKPADWERFKSLPGVPTVDQFTSYEDYSMAMASFIADTRYQERESERSSVYQAHRRNDAESAQLSRWNDRLTEARSSNPGFDASLNLETPMSLPMQHLAMESPQGIEILQWLSDNPQESQRISTLHPAETYREMGKIEARLEAAPPRASARVVSNAKPPVRPLGTSPHVADEFAITDDLSFDEHFRRANAEDRARGRL
jgi:hypothetical protein